MRVGQALPTLQSSFQPSCVNGDHGWPRFESIRELKNDSKWASYYEHVYGELPTDFPVCAFDLWFIDRVAFKSTGLERIHPPNRSRMLRAFYDKQYTWTDGEIFEKRTHLPNFHYSKQYAIYHSDRPYAGSNQWIEVTYLSRGWGVVGESELMWFSYARGSGIWFWTGRHRIFDTHHHMMNVLCKRNYVNEDFDLAACAKKAGLDSFSFRTSQPDPPGLLCLNLLKNVNSSHLCKGIVTKEGTMSTWGLVGFYELATRRLRGRFPCGAPVLGGKSAAGNASAALFRAGWKASRPCGCSNQRSKWLNCAPEAQLSPLDWTLG